MVTGGKKKKLRGCYCLTGDVSEEKALFILGNGRNGKGTLTEKKIAGGKLTASECWSKNKKFLFPTCFLWRNVEVQAIDESETGNLEIA